jgi:hypothetical protein
MITEQDAVGLLKVAAYINCILTEAIASHRDIEIRMLNPTNPGQPIDGWGSAEPTNNWNIHVRIREGEKPDSSSTHRADAMPRSISSSEHCSENDEPIVIHFSDVPSERYYGLGLNLPLISVDCSAAFTSSPAESPDESR